MVTRTRLEVTLHVHCISCSILLTFVLFTIYKLFATNDAFVTSSLLSRCPFSQSLTGIFLVACSSMWDMRRPSYQRKNYSPYCLNEIYVERNIRHVVLHYLRTWNQTRWLQTPLLNIFCTARGRVPFAVGRSAEANKKTLQSHINLRGCERLPWTLQDRHKLQTKRLIFIKTRPDCRYSCSCSRCSQWLLLAVRKTVRSMARSIQTAMRYDEPPLCRDNGAQGSDGSFMPRILKASTFTQTPTSEHLL